jgi:hypothetical protein
MLAKLSDGMVLPTVSESLEMSEDDNMTDLLAGCGGSGDAIMEMQHFERIWNDRAVCMLMTDKSLVYWYRRDYTRALCHAI